MASIFTKIINRDIPGHVVAETSEYIALLDISPVQKGHTLVIPKKEVDYLFDVDDETLAGLNIFAKIVAKGIKKVIPCNRIGVVVIGLEVPHAHIHLIPISQEGDLSFNNPRKKLTPEEMSQLAEDIRNAIAEVVNQKDQ